MPFTKLTTEPTPTNPYIIDSLQSPAQKFGQKIATSKIFCSLVDENRCIIASIWKELILTFLSVSMIIVVVILLSMVITYLWYRRQYRSMVRHSAGSISNGVHQSQLNSVDQDWQTQFGRVSS